MHPRTILWLAALLPTCRRAPPGSSLPPPEPPVRIEVVDAGATSVRAVPVTPMGGCPAAVAHSALGPGTLHGGMVRTAETWTAQGSPHHLPFGAHVIEHARVTIEPCAVVLVGSGRELVVEAQGTLVARGDSTHPIVIDGDTETPRPGDWLGVDIAEGASQDTALGYVRVAHGGADRHQRGEVSASLRSAMNTDLWCDHVTVSESATWGVALTGTGGFHGSSGALTVQGARGEGAVFFSNADVVRTLPATRLEGNARDVVEVAARQRELRTSGTWRSLGALGRYEIAPSAHVMVQGSDDPILTLSPGVHVSFGDDAELDVGWDAPGGLLADGGDPRGTITFDSARPASAPATWTGLFFGPRTDVAHSRIRHARIEGAGAESGFGMVICQPEQEGLGDDGMVVLQGVDAPDLIAQTVFLAGPSTGFAIVRSGIFDVAPGDLTRPALGNDFSRAGTRCAQSTARVGGQCPREIPCENTAIVR